MSGNRTPDIDYRDIRMWRNNPELILRTAWSLVNRFGLHYEDREDLHMFIVEAMLKMIEKFDPSRGTSAGSQIWQAGRRAIMDYGRKYGRHFRGRNPETRVHFSEFEYHEIDAEEMYDSPGMGRLNEARYKGATWDNHENYDFIQTLKKENDLTRKIVFCFYFLEMRAYEIAEELGCSEDWVNKKLRKFRDKYYKENYRSDNSKSLFSCLEDLPMEKLEDFYELVMRQSNHTSQASSQDSTQEQELTPSLSDFGLE